ncbi:hypothetical protein PIB30_082023 [Stylosanthes scabra]|uniref:Uncharacterized protein n=1 Tax=Stylosanthes scabra TaxID=79078 RepID=A0ABU6YQP6_9FABA|nr:hypothetical protein [Stylosanthes scabra]
MKLLRTTADLHGQWRSADYQGRAPDAKHGETVNRQRRDERCRWWRDVTNGWVRVWSYRPISSTAKEPAEPNYRRRRTLAVAVRRGGGRRPRGPSPSHKSQRLVPAFADSNAAQPPRFSPVVCRHSLSRLSPSPPSQVCHFASFPFSFFRLSLSPPSQVCHLLAVPSPFSVVGILVFSVESASSHRFSILVQVLASYINYLKLRISSQL